jgi:hypothetical protein
MPRNGALRRPGRKDHWEDTDMRRFPTLLLCASALLVSAVACSDDDTTLAKGEDVELDGSEGLGDQMLNIDVEEEGGEVSGTYQVSEVVVRVDCANTDTDGFVILGGEVTTGSPGFVEVGESQALIIEEGDPASVALYGDDGAGSCTELVDSVPDDLLTDRSNFAAVAAGSDIETG